MIVTTKSGTRYLIDLEAKTWERLSATDRSGPLRTESGKIVYIEGPVIGESMIIVGPPLNGSSLGQVIFTSLVVGVEEE